MFSSAGGGPPPASAQIPSPSVAMVQQQQPQQQHQQQQQQSQQLPSAAASAAVALSESGAHSNGHQLASSSPDSANNNHPHHHLKSVGPSSVITTASTTSTTTAAASMAALSPEAASLSTSPVVYGELIILGYNGSLPQGEKGRRRSKYQLMRRLAANGIKKSKHYSVKQPQTSKAIQDKDLHSISFTLCRSQAIIVEYQHDEETDMFQIGRSSESPIDFVVIDTVMLDPSRSSSSAHSSSSSQHRAAFNGNGHHHHHQQPHHPQQQPHNSNHSSSCDYLSAPSTTAMATTTGHPFSSPPKPVQQSTISRFACRILVDRRPPYCARIYAAGFDSSKNIFLGEKATKWQANGEIDGLTTNGILIMHPKRPFLSRRTSKPDQQQQPPDLDDMGLLFGEQLHLGSNGAAQPPPPPPGQGHLGGVWREVSVCGEIYSVRETRSASQKGVRIEAETNVLQDGTLIDLCGATLMWRSAEGLRRSPTRRHLEEMIDALNASRPQCPGRPQHAGHSEEGVSRGRRLWGYHDWGHVKADGSAKDKGNGGGGEEVVSGPVVRLTMGIEPSFWASSATPSYAFNPCGHMASETTTSYWSQVLIPHGTNGFHAMCPFCATPLGGETGYVKLIFQ
ncbi:E3 ubiquitin-protein ligase pellino 1 [Tyrophagus putrescentiae]|nr:E3 ubiquitin-protein ligase pellino 1 [Tyrophagus putrescentiae]